MTDMSDRRKTYPIGQIQVLSNEISAAIRPLFDEIDQQRARADKATARLDQARDAVRNGDWHGLRAALGVDRERLPEMYTALDTAAELDGGLTAEQEIRCRALYAAVDAGTYIGVDVATTEVLALAGRFEAYIRYGDLEPDDIASTPPDSE